MTTTSQHGALTAGSGSRPPQMTVAVRLHLAGEGDPQVVVSAVSMLFQSSPRLRVVFTVPDPDLDREAARQVSALVAAAPPPARFPDADLLGESEAVLLEPILSLDAGASPAADARAVVLLAALAESCEEGPASEGRSQLAPPTPEFGREPPGPHRRIAARTARASTLLARGERDRRRISRPDPKIRICVVLQHVTYWGAVQTVCEAWSVDPRVELVLVGLESFVHSPEASADLLTAAGYDVRGASWLQSHLGDLDVVVLDSPYDDFRPAFLHARAVASSGVRLVYVPYASSGGASPLLDRMLFDLPLQNLAWRVYVRSEGQVRQHEQVCSVGAEHLRVLGTPKADRALRASVGDVGRAWRARADGRPIVLWNPHYSVPKDPQIAWSTYHEHVEGLVSFFRTRSDALLLVRPHFRLWMTLRSLGPRGERLETFLRDAESRCENVLIDDNPDYEQAFSVTDVLVSDASSLIPEFMPTGRPIIYTHRSDGPGLSSDAAYVADLYQVSSPKELRLALSALLDGHDRGRERRLRSVEKHFPREDGRAGARIAADVVTSCLREWGL